MDSGVSASEGLALVEPRDLKDWWFSHLFLAKQPPGTTGLARRLNPKAYYLAMRWDYEATPKAILRNSYAKVTANGRTVWCRCIDWGPHERTGRVVDLSPGAADALGVQTDDVVTVELLVP